MEDLSARLADKQDQRKELSNIRAKYAKALQVASEESRREGLKQNYAVICEEEEQCKKNLKAYDEKTGFRKIRSLKKRIRKCRCLVC